MLITSVRGLGAAIKGARLQRGWTQSQLANAAGTSRAWIVAIEQGKSSAEVGSVLRTIAALGLEVDVRPSTAPSHGAVDLDDLLGDH